LGQQQHTLDIDRVIAEKKILLVNLQPRMGLDRENANLLGILLINELFRAAMLRDPDQNPHPFFLYVDEFAQLITPTVANILDECRKYGLFLTLAHQHLEQLRKEDEYLFASVLTNCHNRIVFGGLSAEDAELLSRELYTGFEDLKRIKHVAWQTKFRPVEEERIVRSENRGRNLGWSEMYTESAGAASSRSHSLGDAISRGQSRGLSRTANWSQGSSRTHNRSQSWQQGGQESEGESREAGVSRSQNWSDGTSEQSGQSAGFSTSRQQGEQSGTQEQESGSRVITPEGRTLQKQEGSGGGSSLISSHSEGETEQQQSSRSRGQSHQEGGGETHTRSNSLTRQQGANWSEGQQIGVADQRSESRGGGVSESTGEQESRTRTESHGTTETASSQQSRGRGRQGGETEGVSESRIPFLSPKEFKEGQESFWTLQEIQYLRTGQLKELPVGTASMKLGVNAPRIVRVGRLSDSPRRGTATDRAIADFVARVAAACPGFYSTPAAIQAEVTGRQTAVFGEVMRLNLRAAPGVVAAAPAVPQLPAAAVTSPVSGSFNDGDDEDG
jgi:hypothetical protein